MYYKIVIPPVPIPSFVVFCFINFEKIDNLNLKSENIEKYAIDAP
jgi:hypothetical protein